MGAGREIDVKVLYCLFDPVYRPWPPHAQTAEGTPVIVSGPSCCMRRAGRSSRARRPTPRRPDSRSSRGSSSYGQASNLGLGALVVLPESLTERVSGARLIIVPRAFDSWGFGAGARRPRVCAADRMSRRKCDRLHRSASIWTALFSADLDRRGVPSPECVRLTLILVCAVPGVRK